MSFGFTKVGELVSLDGGNVESPESVLSDPAIEARFKKMAIGLKRIAPKADDFLYFSCKMIHSAEAALINADGSPKKTLRGEIATAYWEEKGDSMKWICNDPNIMPYKNSNGDIFPEKEILKAYKNWIGKPLCTNHESTKIDAVRGIILDVYYDRNSKGVIALCALDKVSFPELARGITTGYKTNFSMGTAVGRCICMSCGKVARTERDFCHHMQTKSSYGEINADLNPLELSVVVQGADPAAKLRSIIASANTISAQLDSETHTTEIQELEDTLKSASDKLNELKAIIDEEDKNSVDNQSSGRFEDPVSETNQEPFTLNVPEKLSSTYNNALLEELKSLGASIETKLTRLEYKIQTTKEELMSTKNPLNKEAYFQGGGGVNEPTPGQRKYPVDPMNEKLRMEDRQMVGQSPFPEVGPVDGMHPSPASAEPKDELERKKMLARAEVEQRALRRAAALQKAKENLMNTKEAYWQGGGGVNEPTPGQKKYPVDPLQDKLRVKEDKQMVGQKPFPGVGDVDGLHPSPESVDEKDELERKKMLARASYKAKFVRVANVDGTDNLGDSGWQVYAKNESGEKLVMTATVNEISGGNSDALFDVIATKEFGTKMLEKIRSVGLDKAASVYKKAQAVAEPGGTPGAPMDMGGAGPAPAMPDAAAPPMDAAPDEGAGSGDPKETALKLAEKVRDMSSDLLEAVKSLTGEQAQMGELEEGVNALPKAASETLLPLCAMRKELNGALLSGMKKSLAELNEHGEELELVSGVLSSNTSANKDVVNTIVDEAIADAKSAIADGLSLMRAYVKYARGTEGLVKKAEDAERASLVALADEDVNDAKAHDKTTKTHDDEDDKTTEPDTSDANDVDLSNDVPMLADDSNDHMGMDDMLLPEHNEADEFETTEDMPEVHLDTNDVMMDVDPASLAGKKVEIKANKQFDLTTKEGRSAYRAKLAADATGKYDDGELKDEASLPYTDMLDKSNALADGQTKLDVKPSDDLGRIETLEERHKKMMDVAKAGPKVRKEAERLNTLISEGKVSVNDLDSLVAEGLDSEVVKYWRQFWGEAGKEGSEFARMLTTETMKAKQAEEMNTFKVKIARAYELANDMVRRGLLADERLAISAQVDEIMKFNDEGFEALKRVVAKHNPISVRKEASIPLVGQFQDTSNSAPALDFQSELDMAFSKKRYGY